MPEQAHLTAGLGSDDYRALYGMLVSSDAETRSQGQALAQKLTPAEHQELFDFQQQVHQGQGDRRREDNSVAGVPPELAVTGALGIGRAAVGGGASVAGKVIAGAKQTVATATPMVKYEGTKELLERMGVPTPLAVTAAMAFAGYQRGSKVPSATVSAEAAAPEMRPAASAPVRPAAAASTPAPVAGPALRLTTEEQQAVDGLVKQGYSRDAVLAQVEQSRSTTPISARKPAELTLKASETKEYMRLLKAGKTSQEARELIQAQRGLIQRLGLPTADAARQAVQDRNAKGRWPEE